MPECSNCDREVSWEAKVCPGCGQPEPWRKSGHWYADVDDVDEEQGNGWRFDELERFVDSMNADEVNRATRGNPNWRLVEKIVDQADVFIHRRHMKGKGCEVIEGLLKFAFTLGARR